jgi:hypothetical protein
MAKVTTPKKGAFLTLLMNLNTFFKQYSCKILFDNLEVLDRNTFRITAINGIARNLCS